VYIYIYIYIYKIIDIIRLINLVFAKPHDNTYIFIYIYIYIWRERERERCLARKQHMKVCQKTMSTWNSRNKHMHILTACPHFRNRCRASPPQTSRGGGVAGAACREAIKNIHMYKIILNILDDIILGSFIQSFMNK